VTHDMSTVQAFCDRALVLHDGAVRYLGDPEEAALRYYRLNFGGAGASGDAVRVVDAWLEDAAGARVDGVPQRSPIAFNVVVEADRDVPAPIFGIHVVNRDGAVVLGFGGGADGDLAAPAHVPAGARVRLAGRIDNPLIPGRYALGCTVARNGAPGDLALRVPELIEFDVERHPDGARGDVPIGMVAVAEDVRAVIEGARR
jgi:ABC-2 type transport system ATP-binding protein